MFFYDDEDKYEMKNRILTLVISIVLSAIILFCLYIVIKPIVLEDGYSPKIQNNTQSADLNRIEEVLNRISSQYVDEIDKEKLIEGAINGIASATDDVYTRYMTEEEYNELLTSGTEVYSGIGVHIVFDDENNAIMILGIMPDSPALKAGLNIGDYIIKVGDVEVTKDTYQKCTDMLKGDEGTSVNITLKRANGNVEEKTLTRASINENNVSSEIINDNIGYIKIWEFENNICKQFKEQYDNLRAKKVKGIVLDLRNNPGGIVDETVEIAKLLLPQCDIVKLVYRGGNEKVYKCDGKNEIDIPLTVLVNSNSASAAEILSGAIKDSGKGILIGNKTYGKGIVQSIQKLKDGKGALSITTAKYYTASGVEIHKNGIEPNITVDLPAEYKNVVAAPKDKDTQLQKAIEYINSK